MPLVTFIIYFSTNIERDNEVESNSKQQSCNDEKGQKIFILQIGK